LKSFDLWVCIPSAKGELIRNRSLGAGSKFHRITSNKSLTEWGRVLHDTALAAALVDRLLHHGEVYYLKGDSYRLRGKPRPAEAPASADSTPEGE
jgi:IstB-like ATP binding protein